MAPTNHYEAVVIGGGIVGCAIAFELVSRGLSSVAVIEKGTLAGGATGICPGGIRQQFEGRQDCLLARRSLKFWERINEILAPEQPFEFERSGYLFLAYRSTQLERYRHNVAVQNEVGVPSTLLTATETNRMLPHLRFDGLEGAAFCSQDGFIEDCHGITTLLAQRAVEKGAVILIGTVVALQAHGDSWRLETDRGPVQARHVVVAAGWESSELLSAVGWKAPIVAQRRRLAFTLPYSQPIMLPLVVASELEFAGKQLRNGVFYLGWLGESEEDDEWDFIERSLGAASRLSPVFEELPVRHVLSGLYDNTPDRRPLLGPVPGCEGLWIAAGFSGHGFMIAPAVAQGLAEEILEGREDATFRSYSPTRFSRGQRIEGLVI